MCTAHVYHGIPSLHYQVHTIVGMETRGYSDGDGDTAQFGTLLSVAALNACETKSKTTAATKAAAAAAVETTTSARMGGGGGSAAVAADVAHGAASTPRASAGAEGHPMMVIVADNSSGAVRAVDVTTGRTVTIAGARNNALGLGVATSYALDWYRIAYFDLITLFKFPTSSILR